MATLAQIVNESNNQGMLSSIDTNRLIAGLYIIHKQRTLLIPMGLDDHLERVIKIKHTKTQITLYTKSDQVVIRTIDLKHHIPMFKII